MKRIVQLVPVFPPDSGGMGVVAERIAYTVPSLETITLTPHSSFHTHKILSVPALRIGNAGWSPLLKKIISEYDHILFHWPFLGAYTPVMRWKEKFPHKKLTVWYHMDLHASDYRFPFFLWAQNYAWPRLSRSADEIICSTSDFWNHSAGFKGAQKKQFIEIHFPLPPQWDEKKILSYENRTRDFIWVGAFDRAHDFKGAGKFIDAMRRLTNEARAKGEKIPSATMVGRGPDISRYQAMAKSLDIDFPSVPWEPQQMALRAMYASHRFFVLPSVSRSESFNLAMMEAQAMGVLALCADMPGVRVVNQWKEGIFSHKRTDAMYIAMKNGLQIDRQTYIRIAQEVQEKIVLFSDSEIWDKKISSLFGI